MLATPTCLIMELRKVINPANASLPPSDETVQKFRTYFHDLNELGGEAQVRSAIYWILELAENHSTSDRFQLLFAMEKMELEFLGSIQPHSAAYRDVEVLLHAGKSATSAGR